MKKSAAEIIKEYGPFPSVETVHGVSFDGSKVWFASGDKLNVLDPETGDIERTVDVPAHAGTAFDGEFLFQIFEDRIQKINPDTGKVVSSIPTPPGGAAGMAWAEGFLWVAQHRNRKIHKVNPENGEILSSIDSNRFVTGVSWVDGELWHATWENDESELRQVNPNSGEVLQSLTMPKGTMVSGLESDGGDRLFCGGGGSGKLRAVRRPQ
ncbi:MAG: glutamine cyclotransferase [Gammaproteobacteria bacterium]|nr:MAG: glutamine cyclotransferase [Gammaproteobacteria bacterium]